MKDVSTNNNPMWDVDFALTQNGKSILAAIKEQYESLDVDQALCGLHDSLSQLSLTESYQKDPESMVKIQKTLDDWCAGSSCYLFGRHAKDEAQYVTDCLQTAFKGILLQHHTHCFGLYLNFNHTDPEILILDLHTHKIIKRRKVANLSTKWRTFASDATYFGFDDTESVDNWSYKSFRIARSGSDVSSFVDNVATSIVSAEFDSNVWDIWHRLEVTPTWYELSSSDRLKEHLSADAYDVLSPHLYSLVAYTDYDGIKWSNEATRLEHAESVIPYLGGDEGVKRIDRSIASAMEDDIFGELEMTRMSVAVNDTRWFNLINESISTGLLTKCIQSCDYDEINQNSQMVIISNILSKTTIEYCETEEHHWSNSVWSMKDDSILSAINKQRLSGESPAGFKNFIDNVIEIQWQTFKYQEEENEVLKIAGHTFEAKVKGREEVESYFVSSESYCTLSTDSLIEKLNAISSMEVLCLIFNVAHVSVSLSGDISIRVANILRDHLPKEIKNNLSGQIYNRSIIEIPITEESAIFEFLEIFDEEYKNNFAYRRLKKFAESDTENMGVFGRELTAFITLDLDIIESMRQFLCDCVEEEYSEGDVLETINEEFELLRTCESHTRV